jgi:hypothetical protein
MKPWVSRTNFHHIIGYLFVAEFYNRKLEDLIYSIYRTDRSRKACSMTRVGAEAIYHLRAWNMPSISMIPSSCCRHSHPPQPPTIPQTSKHSPSPYRSRTSPNNLDLMISLLRASKHYSASTRWSRSPPYYSIRTLLLISTSSNLFFFAPFMRFKSRKCIQICNKGFCLQTLLAAEKDGNKQLLLWLHMSLCYPFQVFPIGRKVTRGVSMTWGVQCTWV